MCNAWRGLSFAIQLGIVRWKPTFRKKHCLHLQIKEYTNQEIRMQHEASRDSIPPKRLLLLNARHGGVSRNIGAFTVTGVGTQMAHMWHVSDLWASRIIFMGGVGDDYSCRERIWDPCSLVLSAFGWHSPEVKAAEAWLLVPRRCWRIGTGSVPRLRTESKPTSGWQKHHGFCLCKQTHFTFQLRFQIQFRSYLVYAAEFCIAVTSTLTRFKSQRKEQEI
jgi:hypothetical protein